MIAFLKGTIHSAAEHHCVIDVQGVGYDVQMSSTDLGRLPTAGASVMVHICHICREDDELLYGFLDAADRSLFQLLLGIRGVGPKSALAIVGGIPHGQLEQVVAQQNVHALTQVPGIGRKTAERLLLELKDKLKTPLGATGMAPNTLQENYSEAMEALAALGYPLTQARTALQKVMDEGKPEHRLDQDPVAELIRRALRYL